MTAQGNSLCLILLAVNSSWDDNGRARTLIIFLRLQERYCFAGYIERVGVCVCITVRRHGGVDGVCVCLPCRCHEWPGDMYH